ncbi:sulfotransferase domain-containing protein [Hyphobacterium sp. CCMP332]|nr:sulfotransferase domain-containing protein [Hyphobacterium sp. CCMP332]
MNDFLPNFLIVGAAKSGTTSLFDQLCRHPEVFKPYIKEPGYFIPLNQYSSINTWEEYQNIFRGANNFKARGEASVTYLFDEQSPELIKEKLGEEVRILIILRNPIDMSYSLWQHRKRDLKEEFDFFEALKLRDTKNPNAISVKSIEYDWDYLNRAKYYEQVKRYIDKFKNVKILIFEDYIKNVNLQFKEVCEFLGINPQITVELESKNTAYKPRFPLIQKALTYQLSIKKILKKILPHNFLVGLKSKVENLNKVETTSQKLDSKDRIKLASQFKEDVENLSKLIGKDLKVYWNEFN